MYHKMIEHCAALGLFKVVFFGVVLAIAIEAFTVWARFGLGLESTRDTGFISALTFSLRIHHGYLGVLLWFCAWWLFREHPGLRNALWTVAIALFLSDMIHHFAVLWPITGSPQFHLVYPQRQ